jgi:hypothetical protein
MSTKFMTKAATTAIPKTTPKSNKNWSVCHKTIIFHDSKIQ